MRGPERDVGTARAAASRRGDTGAVGAGAAALLSVPPRAGRLSRPSTTGFLLDAIQFGHQ
jgi:hypothetical protein